MPDGNNALVRAPISAGGQVAAIVAHSFDDAYRIANALAASGITPFKKTEECLAVIMAGAELGLTPFAATQSFAVINGRVSIWGDGMMAVVRARGVRVAESLLGEGDKMVATCTVTRPDSEDAVTRSFSMVDAKRAGLAGKSGPWTQYPQRMLQMRARAWAIRDACADMLRGLKMAEEMQDVEPLEARVVDRASDADQRPPEDRDPRINPKYGVIGGQAGKDVFDEIAQRMSEVTAEDELDAIWAESAKTPLSANRKDALVEYCEAVRQALRDEAPIPAPPRFAKEEAPSPFDALKAEGQAVATADALQAFTAKLTTDTLGKCTAEQRTELKAIRDAAKQRCAQNEGAGDPRPNEAEGSAPAASAPASSSLSGAEVKKLKSEIVRMVGEAQTLAEVESLPGMFADELARAPQDVRENAERIFAEARAKFAGRA